MFYFLIIRQNCHHSSPPPPFPSYLRLNGIIRHNPDSNCSRFIIGNPDSNCSRFIIGNPFQHRNYLSYQALFDFWKQRKGGTVMNSFFRLNLSGIGTRNQTFLTLHLKLGTAACEYKIFFFVKFLVLISADMGVWKNGQL